MSSKSRNATNSLLSASTNDVKCTDANGVTRRLRSSYSPADDELILDWSDGCDSDVDFESIDHEQHHLKIYTHKGVAKKVRIGNIRDLMKNARPTAGGSSFGVGTPWVGYFMSDQVLVFWKKGSDGESFSSDETFSNGGLSILVHKQTKEQCGLLFKGLLKLAESVLQRLEVTPSN